MTFIPARYENDLWTSPEGYDRTSKKLQFEYLEKLLSKINISGRVLDVGSGTDNSLAILETKKIDDYLGIDISEAMIKHASARFPMYGSNFMQSDFLDIDTKALGEFDHAICAACLHWFHPHQAQVISLIHSLLKDKGYLHLSTARTFDYISEEDTAQKNALDKVRKAFKPIKDPETFSSRRANRDFIAKILKSFRIISISQHEEQLSFDNFEDFKDWHVGSGSRSKTILLPRPNASNLPIL